MTPLTQGPAARGQRPPAPAPGQLADLPKVQSHDLLQGGNLILIEHAGDRYYLRMTRNNKLILTK